MKRRGIAILVLMAAFLAGFSGCHKKKQEKSVSKREKKEAKIQKRSQSAEDIRTVDIRSVYILGNPQASVVVVEFTDFQCPFCRRFHHQTFPLIKKNYIDAGKVKWVTYNFPLRFHQFAFPAARGLVCAGEIGGEEAFWDYYMKIFAVPVLNPASPAEVASEIGLDRTKFGECLDSEEARNRVASNIRYGNAIGIRGTPTFIIGRDNGDGTMTGEVVVGAQPYEVFKSKLDSLLSE